LTKGHPQSFDFHISFDWSFFGPLPSPFRDVGLHLGHSDCTRWLIHSYSHIIARPLTSASDFAHTHLCFDWLEIFDMSKRALSCIPFMHFIWGAPLIWSYLYSCEDCVRLFDKQLLALVGFDERQLMSLDGVIDAP